MNKFDEALEELQDYKDGFSPDIVKITEALELGKLYQKYYKEYDDLTLNEATDIINKIKELENDK